MRFAPMTALADRIDRLTTAVGRAVAWLALVIVLLQFALVVARYVFGLGSIWLTETVIYAHATLFMLAAAWTLQAGGHVRVDVFYAEASPRTQGARSISSARCCCCCRSRWCWSGWRCPTPRAPGRSSSARRRSSGLPLVFVLKTLIPLFALLMALQGIAQAIRALRSRCDSTGRR